MSLRHLQIFTQVVDCGNMSKAAKQLNISQPSVSQAISELEKQYGVILFERLSHKLFLTKEGTQLLSFARHIIDSYKQMEEAMSEEHTHKQITIGCSVSVGTCYILPLLELAKAQLPNCSFQIMVSNTSEIEQALLENKIDVGIVEGKVNNANFNLTPLCLDELVVVAGIHHPLSSLSSIPLAMLQNEAYLSRERGSSDKNQYELYLEEHEIHLHKVFYSTNTEAIKNATIANYGIAIFSKKMIEQEVNNHQLVILPIKDVRITRNIQFLIHKDKFISNEIKQFQQLCMQYL